MNTQSLKPLWQRPLFWFCIALLIRLAYLLEQGFTSVLFYQQLLDEQEFALQAQKLIAGEGFGPEPFFKAPFYSTLVAGTMIISGDAWIWVLRFLQHTCGALLAVFAFDVTRRISGTRKQGYLAAAFAAAAITFYGPLVRLENRLIADFLTVFFQSTMLWAMIRYATNETQKTKWRWALTAGFFAAISWLTRPTITPLLPFLVFWMAWPLLKNLKLDSLKSRRIITCTSIFILLPLIAIATFTIRNKQVANEALWLPWQGGYNFYQANRDGANGRYLHQSSWSNNATGNPTYELMIAGYRQNNKQIANPGPKQINAWWFHQAIANIKQNPESWMSLMFSKVFYLISAREIFNFEDYNVQRKLSNILPWLFLNFGVLWPFVLVSLLVIPQIQKSRRSVLFLIWMYALILGGAISLYFTSGRLRMPLVFPAIILASLGFAYFLRQVNRFYEKTSHPHLIRQTALCLILILLGALMSWNDWRGVRSEEVRHYEYARLSNAAWHDRQFGMALEFAQKCERIDSNYPRLAVLKGQAFYSLKRYQEAAREFALATKSIPQDASAPFNFGILCYYHLNNPAEAVVGFLEALQRNPNHENARWLAARAYVRLKEFDKAERLLAPYYLDEKPVNARDFFISATALYQSMGDEKVAIKWIQRIEENFGAKGINELVSEMKTAKIQFPKQFSNIAEIHN